MAQPSSLSTNNPFRRKQASTLTPNPPIQLADDAFAHAFDPLPTSSSSSLDPTPPALPSGDDFRNSLQSLGQSSEPPPKTSFQKPKVVKKVRVQSPPPSPESEEESDTYPPAEEDTAESSSSDDEMKVTDPFAQVPPPTSTQSPGGAVPGEKGSLDVDSFRRLLLTGQAGGTVQPPRTDASSTLTSQDPSRTSHGIPEQEREEPQSQRTHPTLQTPGTSRSKAPPPPPPSSRHGKLIKVDPNPTPVTPRPSSSPSSARASRVLASPFPEQPNKTPPPPPLRSPGEEDLESPFDHEAAGKVLELGQEINPTTATPLPSQAPRKPPPPPRRSTHGRSETKVSVSGSVSTPVATPQASRLEEEPKRSSMDSIRSRSSSLQVASSTVNASAPAPPPPRRSTHVPRPSTSTAGLGIGISSPAVASAGAEGTEFPGLAAQPASGSAQSSRPSTPANSSNNPETASISSFNQPGHGRTFSGSGRLAPPPPPPARNKSVRSGTPSTPGTVRRADSGRSREPIGLASPAPIAPSPNHAPPPPPRPRPRGSNRRSVSGSGSVDSGNPAPAPGTVESPAPVRPPPAAPAPGLGGAGARFLEASLALDEEPRGLPDGMELATADTKVQEQGFVDGNEDEEDVMRRESAAKDILADLDALQREVDALRAAQEQGRTTTL
ncbi:hypothetical protein N0V85_003071 [Neurospora sp. IMI 360204]|nr:hypothetical protein N0V85_003071 [Neurospora sp. IMI 360204]